VIIQRSESRSDSPDILNSKGRFQNKDSAILVCLSPQKIPTTNKDKILKLPIETTSAFSQNFALGQDKQHRYISLSNQVDPKQLYVHYPPMQ
jgi:hypothetical protein